MADDTTKGLAAITAQLVGTNDKLDGLLTAAQGNLSPAELKAKNQDDDASTNKSNSLLEKIGIGIGNNSNGSSGQIIAVNTSFGHNKNLCWYTQETDVTYQCHCQ